MRSILPVLLALGTAACGADEPDGGAWEFSADTAPAAGGDARRAAWLRVVVLEGAEGKPRTDPVILRFDCLPDDTPSTIVTRQALRQGSAKARLTLDADPPLELSAFAGTTESGGQVVLTVPQDSLLELLRGHRIAVVEYEDGAGSSQTSAEFPLEGLETYRRRFLTACGRSAAS